MKLITKLSFTLLAFLSFVSLSHAQDVSTPEERALLAAYDYYINSYEISPVPTAKAALERTRFYNQTAFCVNGVAILPTHRGNRRTDITGQDMRRVYEEFKSGCKNTKSVTLSKEVIETKQYFTDKFLPEYLEEDTLHFVIMSHPSKIRKDIYYLDIVVVTLVKGNYVIYAGDGRHEIVDYGKAGKGGGGIDAFFLTSFLYDDLTKRIYFPESENSMYGNSPEYCSFINSLDKLEDLKFIWDNKTYDCPD